MLNHLLNFIKKLIPQKLFKFFQPIYHWLLAKLSAFVYGYPSNKMIVVGVTGTTGKSSTCYFTAQILEHAGFKVGMTSTTVFKIAGHEWLNDKKMTMLGRFQSQRLLKDMVKEKCDVAIIETSSQGIEQFRHMGINYDILVFTNLYPEHIEAHGGFENYKKAKGKLFEYLGTLKHKNIKTLKQTKEIEKTCPEFAEGLEIKKLRNFIKKTIIVNGDDENANYFLQFKADRKIIYTTRKELMPTAKSATLCHSPEFNSGESGNPETRQFTNYIRAQDIKKTNNGYQFLIHNSLFIIPLLGDYNIYNVLPAIAVAQLLGVPGEEIKQAVAQLKPLPGRLEFIENNLGLKIIVDYAFEPRALEKLYETVKKIEHKKILHVLGSTGGGRDKARRPILGKIAAENADIVIITNEDPYEEVPMEIIEEVATGVLEVMILKTDSQISNFQFLISNKIPNSILNPLKQVQGQDQIPNSLYKILDRREAIRKALTLAEKGDMILITGKGAEQKMCLAGGKMIDWDDRRVIKEELEKLKNS